MISEVPIQTKENQDPYVSRIKSSPYTIDRVDPVTYTNSHSKVLSKEQISEYKKNGFLFLKALFSPEEVANLLAQTEELKRTNSLKNSEFAILEPHSQEVRSFFHIHTFDPIFKSLVSDPRILNVVQEILGSLVYIHQSRINLKPGFKGKEFYWHSDFETWHMEDGMSRMRALSCSISLTENNEFNGPLMIIPGSHQKYVVCSGETPEENYKQSLRQQYIGVPDEKILSQLVQKHGILAPKGPAGSVLFFDCNLMHGSNGNISPYPRSNIFFVYNSIENTLGKPYCGLRPRPEYIAVRKDWKPLYPSNTPLYKTED